MISASELELGNFQSKHLDDVLPLKYRGGYWDKYVIRENIMSNQYRRLNLQPDDIVLDIGAHIGTFTVFASKKSKRVISYEASKDNYFILSQNVELNKAKNTTTYHNAVVGDSKESADFYINTQNNTGIHSLIKKRGREVENVLCININKVLEDVCPNKIKMDCEGEEYNIIKNIKPENWNSIKAISFEYHVDCLKDYNRKKMQEVIDVLSKYFKFSKYPKTVSKSRTVLISFWGKIYD